MTCRTCRRLHPYHVPIPVDEVVLDRAGRIQALPRGERGAHLTELAHAAGVSTRSLQRYMRGGGTRPGGPIDLHICATCDRRFASAANARRHVAKYHRTPCLLPDDDTAVEQAVELLAAVEHEQWEKWSREIAEQGLTPERIERWHRYWVPYDQLDEATKEHDRVWARKAIAALREGGQPRE